MEKLKILIYFFVLILWLSCDDDDKKETFLNLSETRIAVDNAEETKILIVKSSSNWTIQPVDNKDWCAFEKKGTDSLVIKISENHTFIARETSVKLSNSDKSITLPVTQGGIEKEMSIGWHTLAVNSISGELKKEGNQYKILAEKLFITPDMRKKIFHASLLNKTFDRSKGVEHINSYTYNPITISAISGGEFFSKENMLPSFDVSNNLAEKIIAKQPQDNVSFSYSSPYQFNSFKHLRMLGLGNLGLNLDEIVNGKPYTEKEMGNTIGLLYSYSQVVFSTVMDFTIPLIKETIDDNLKSNLAYVNEIEYGRIGFLVVESPYDFNLSKKIVKKIIEGAFLNEEEKKVAESFSTTYIFFKENSEIGVNKSGDAIKLFTTEIINQPIIPLSFTVTSFKDNGMGNIEVVFNLP